MYRKNTGRYEITTGGGEQVKAFVPLPLPPTPEIDLVDLLPQYGRACTALGKLEGIAESLPDPTTFIYLYVRKEAVLSSQIEGIWSTLSDLLRYEINEAPGAHIDDVTEVSNCVTALEHGINRMEGGFPLSNRLIKEMHELLLSTGIGNQKMPGEFRKSQNWIGGTRPGTARFVPPPSHFLPDCMSDLEKFIHSNDSRLPPLIKAGMVHVQFETIHPFLDGNGRVGRMLILLMLWNDRIVTQPLLYLSLYFKLHREVYYDLLNEVRKGGDWEAWLVFFLEGIEATALSAVDTAQNLIDLLSEDRSKIRQSGRKANSALRLHQAFQERPLFTIKELEDKTKLGNSVIASGIKVLEDFGVVSEISGKRRGKIFVYTEYLNILNEGTEPEQLVH